MDKQTDKPDADSGGRAHKAGALDIRNVIGGLLSTYGVILLVLGDLRRHRGRQDRRRERQPVGGAGDAPHGCRVPGLGAVAPAGGAAPPDV